MKKLFFILVAFIALGAFAQEIERYRGIIFSVSDEGDSIYYYADGNSSARKKNTSIDPQDDVADCKCYQGPDRETKNKPYGSCCWVDPATTNYPYCTYGCI